MGSQKISVVINVINKDLPKDVARALQSVEWADEIVVCDMGSTDQTIEVAKKLGAKIVTHPFVNYVEPARNFAISKAQGEWVLILDPDEEIPEVLAERLREIAKGSQTRDFIEIPRKNIIFGKWMKGSGWWPDYNIRFFKKGSVKWGDKIHRPPETSGESLQLPLKEESAIVHYHYSSVSQFLERMNRYTDVQAQELCASGYKFTWQDLINKPLGEFLGRFFANRGFEDGLHGMALSLLQAFSFLVVYLKVWEMDKFPQQELSLPEVEREYKKGGKEISYWFGYSTHGGNFLKKILRKARLS